MKRILVIISVMLIAMLLIPSAAALADKTYHTERLSLAVTDEGAIAGHTMRNGMVVNIHPDGPVNGAIEKYILNGARPNTDYQVWWEIVGMGELPTNFAGEPTPIVVHTDNQGNGQCTYKITRDFQIEYGFVGFEGMLRWLFKDENGITAFQTDWTDIIVD